MKPLVMLLCFVVASPLVFGQRRGPGPRSYDNAPPPLAQNEAEKKILSVLNQMQQTGTTHLSVPQSDGRVLRLLAEAVNAKHVVEIGTSTGHSGLWLCMALQRTGGKLTTYEYDKGRAATARQHFAQAGVDGIATVIQGDAHENVKQLKGPVDVAFIDADKEGYEDYLQKLLPLVRPGGLILAHNVNPGMAQDGFVKQVTGNPDLETVFYLDGGGLSVTLKKR